MDTQQSYTETPQPESQEPVSTHVLVPKGRVFKLRELARRTRIHQSEYLREALEDVLRKYQGPEQPAPAPSTVVDEGGLLSVVFRVAPGRLEALKDLAKKTRVRQSEYLREAIEDVLAKYKEHLQDEQQPVRAVAHA